VAEAISKGSTGQTSPSPEDEATRYEKMTRSAEAQHRYATTIDGLLNPASVQEMREKRERGLEEERKAAEARAQALQEQEYQRLQQEREDAARHAAEEEQKREQAEAALRDHQNQMLMKKLEELQGSQKPMQDQLNEYISFAETLATRMGFERPAGAAPTQDPTVTLELEKMKLQASREERKFQWEMEQDRRKWDLQLQRLTMERESKKAELEQAKQKDELFATLPQRIGQAIVAGWMDRGSGNAPGGGPVGQPAPQQPQRAYQIQVSEGEYGEIDCPHCQTKVGVGPTSSRASCVGCNAQFGVARTPSAPAQDDAGAPPDDYQIPEYYEEDV